MKIGILGGGQLGRMFIQEGLKYDDEFHTLDPDKNCPCAHISHFNEGNFNDFETVYNFGKDKDIVTIEIEHINVEALEKLESEGIKVIPRPHIIKTIQQKILQKDFYKKNLIPTPNYQIIERKEQLSMNFPFVQKMNTGGYDGKGVQVIKDKNDLHKLWDCPSVIEEMVDIDKELSIIVAKNSSNQIAMFPITEMIADPKLNLLDFNISPANITDNVKQQIETIALSFINAAQSEGLFAIELFLDKAGKIWVNETAPRLHNSGHLTQEGNYNSQFEQFYRVVRNLPLADTTPISFSGMLNLVGEDNHSGKVHYKGIEEVLKIPQTYIHLYGKTDTKPGRKMGHINVLSSNREELIYKLSEIKSKVKVISIE